VRTVSAATDAFHYIPAGFRLSMTHGSRAREERWE